MHEFEGMPWQVPFTLGHENAGWVDSIGAGVTGLSVGDAVAVFGAWGCGRCRRCLIGMENVCENQGELGGSGGGLGFDGGMAPLMLVPHARWLVPLGDLDPVAAAPLSDAALTPYHAIKRALPALGPGTTAVVIGAGGLGQMAVQLLKCLSPASLIVVDQRAGALESARQLGADHTVLSGDTAAAEVRELTSGRGAEAVFDVVGVVPTLALAAAVVRPLGHLMIIGIGGGTLPVGFFTLPSEASVTTSYWGTIPELYEVIALARAGKISARVTRYSLDDAHLAYEAMQNGSLDGRAVIVPN
jgi:propanol-preferring alcohol dehydrogenase